MNSILGEARHIVTCSECNTTSSTPVEQFNSLQLPMATTLASSFQAYFAPFALAPDDYWYLLNDSITISIHFRKCPQCRDFKPSQQTSEIVKWPPVVVVQLRRFQSKEGKTFKDNRLMDCPLALSLGEQQLTLFGICEHRGETPNSGHYVARVRRGI